MYVCSCYSSIISRVHIACVGGAGFTKVGKHGFVRAASHDANTNFGRSQEVTTFVKIRLLQHRWHEPSIQYIQASAIPLSTSQAHRHRRVYRACLLYDSHIGLYHPKLYSCADVVGTALSQATGVGVAVTTQPSSGMRSEKENAKGPGAHR